MDFVPTPINGVSIVELLRYKDDRGSFGRLWCQRESLAANLPGEIVQMNLSINAKRGTLRGMHFQSPPSREGKFVHCVQGKIYDVALDLRPRSSTYLGHFGIELAETEPRALFIPAGCAHGFLTLTPNCAVLYMMTDFYEPTLASGVRWNDPAFGIEWPERPSEILERDALYPDFNPRSVDGFSDY